MFLAKYTWTFKNQTISSQKSSICCSGEWMIQTHVVGTGMICDKTSMSVVSATVFYPTHKMKIFTCMINVVCVVKGICLWFICKAADPVHQVVTEVHWEVCCGAGTVASFWDKLRSLHYHNKLWELWYGHCVYRYWQWLQNKGLYNST